MSSEIDISKWHQLGPDPLVLFEWNTNNLKLADWVVYWYREDGYEGSGVLVCKWATGEYGMTNLSHCSCYGPIDDAPHTFTLKAILADLESSPEDYDYAENSAVLAKVRELI